MLLVQMTGLSGAGKSTIAQIVSARLAQLNHKVEVIDGDEFRKGLCRDLGFSADDRKENIRRLAFVANLLAKNGIISILAAINPFDDIRKEVAEKYAPVLTVWVNCELSVLARRDPKGLYRRANLPTSHPEKLHNLSGVDDPFEPPSSPDVVLNTHKDRPEESAEVLLDAIVRFLDDRNSIKSKKSYLGTSIKRRQIQDNTKRSLFIGRWQPFHKGHQWLIDQKLKLRIPVLIAVRDIPPDKLNPFTTEQTIDMIQTIYDDQNVRIMPIPDIDSVNYGRGVGYEINELKPPDDICAVSATELREALTEGNDSWKQYVNERIHDQIVEYLK